MQLNYSLGTPDYGWLLHRSLKESTYVLQYIRVIEVGNCSERGKVKVAGIPHERDRSEWLNASFDESLRTKKES